VCAQGFYKMAANSPVSECAPCPNGVVRCVERDTTLATMHAAPGWWRASDRSAEWHFCGRSAGSLRFDLLRWRQGLQTVPAIAINGSGHRVSRAVRLCKGGKFPPPSAFGAMGYCRKGQFGPLCQSCYPEDSTRHTYFDAITADCRACRDWGELAGIALLIIVGLFCALVVFRSLLMYIDLRPKRTSSHVALRVVDMILVATSRLLRRLVIVLRTGSFMPQLKLFISFAQGNASSGINLACPDTHNIVLITMHSSLV
jgi:hypothetical protein